MVDKESDNSKELCKINLFQLIVDKRFGVCDDSPSSITALYKTSNDTRCIRRQRETGFVFFILRQCQLAKQIFITVCFRYTTSQHTCFFQLCGSSTQIMASCFDRVTWFHLYGLKVLIRIYTIWRVTDRSIILQYFLNWLFVFKKFISEPQFFYPRSVCFVSLYSSSSVLILITFCGLFNGEERYGQWR